MKNDFKKMFFSSLLTVLFIISNLIGLKYTTFGNMIVSVNFITYPFITLCILILLDKYEKKDAYYAIISTVFIQIFILLSYSLTVNMNSQVIIPDLSAAVNSVFTVNEVSFMLSLIAFMVSNYITIYLFGFFKKNGRKLFGVILGTLLSLIVYGLLYIVICYYNIEKEILVNLILSHLSISIIMTIIVIALFYILKERDCIYTLDDIEKVNVSFSQEQEFTDKTILEVITLKEKSKNKKSDNLNADDDKLNSNRGKNKNNSTSQTTTSKDKKKRTVKEKTTSNKKVNMHKR